MANMARFAQKGSESTQLQHHACFAVLATVITGVTWKLVSVLAYYAIHDESSSHIVLIPFITAFLVFTTRDNVFRNPKWSIRRGLSTISAGFACYWLCSSHGFVQGRWELSGAAAAIVLVWIGAFLLCYGVNATRNALFPLCLLLLVIPWPEPILSRVIYFLQQGSAGIADVLFRITGTPVLRQGVVLSVPGVTIEVAQECSSIRSSIALFITCLLAAHYSLRTAWKVWFFVAVATVFSVVKNGIRIATLTLLSIYVDPRFLRGPLHRDGGILFFLLALVMLWPVLVLLQKSEAPADSVAMTTATELAAR